MRPIYVDAVLNKQGGRCYWDADGSKGHAPATVRVYTEGGSLFYVCPACETAIGPFPWRKGLRILTDDDLPAVMWPL